MYLIHQYISIASVYTAVLVSIFKNGNQHESFVGNVSISKYLEPSERSWLCCSTPFLKLPQLHLRDTRRETRWFQGGPGRGGRPGTSWFLSWCLSGGAVAVLKMGWSNIANFFLRTPGIIKLFFRILSNNNRNAR
jgi:hypothetical protein